MVRYMKYRHKLLIVITVSTTILVVALVLFISEPSDPESDSDPSSEKSSTEPFKHSVMTPEERLENKRQFIRRILVNVVMARTMTKLDWLSSDMSEKQKNVGIVYDFIAGQNVEESWPEEEKDKWAHLIGYFVENYLGNVRMIDLEPLRVALGRQIKESLRWKELQSIDQEKLRQAILKADPPLKNFF